MYDLKNLPSNASFEDLPDFAVPNPNYKSASKLIKEMAEKIKASEDTKAKQILADVQRTFDPGLAEIYKYRIYRFLRDNFEEVAG